LTWASKRATKIDSLLRDRLGWFDLNAHLIFNECLEEVLPRLVEKLKEYSLPGVQITHTSAERASASFQIQSLGFVSPQL
jgi:hypothetical protein